MFLGFVAGIGLLTGTYVFWWTGLFRPQTRQARLQSCKLNLDKLSWELDFAARQHGVYPARLEELTSTAFSLDQIPECPVAGRDTYSASYSTYTIPFMPHTWCETHGTNGPCANYVRRLLTEVCVDFVATGRLATAVGDLAIPDKLKECPYGGGPLGYSAVLQGYQVYCAGHYHAAASASVNSPAVEGVR